MNLVLDAGNSFLKIGIYDGDKRILVDRIEYNKFNDVINEIFKKYNINHIGTSSVVNESKVNFNILKDYKVYQFDLKSKFPFNINYKTPESLGLDRVIACVGALKYFQAPLLVVDLGSCVTFDYLDENNIYQGGAISPGLSLRAKAMHTFTDKLPLVELNFNKIKNTGKTTEECIKSGLFYGLKAEIEAQMDYYKEKNQNLSVVLTGGDLNFFEDELKYSIFASSNIVLDGLNELIEINAL